MYATNLSHLKLASKGFQHVTLREQSRNKQTMNREEGIIKCHTKRIDEDRAKQEQYDSNSQSK